MDFSNFQIRKLQTQIKELEDDKTHLETELSDALQDPFTKYKKKDPAESTAKRGAPVGHEGHFRSKPDVIDNTIDVYLDQCPLFCESKNISPCNHTTEHIQEGFEDGRLTATCFVHCYYCGVRIAKTLSMAGAIPNAFIGPDARAKASFLRHEIKSSYNDARRTLECFGKLTLTSGTLVGFDNYITRQGQPLYDALKQSLPKTPFIHADETDWKRDWLWIFTNPFISFFHNQYSILIADEYRSGRKGILGLFDRIPRLFFFSGG